MIDISLQQSLNESVLKLGSGGRGTALWSRMDLRKSVGRLVKIRGIRSTLVISSLENLQKLRVNDVHPKTQLYSPVILIVVGDRSIGTNRHGLGICCAQGCGICRSEDGAIAQWLASRSL